MWYWARRTIHRFRILVASSTLGTIVMAGIRAFAEDWGFESLRRALFGNGEGLMAMAQWWFLAIPLFTIAFLFWKAMADRNHYLSLALHDESIEGMILAIVNSLRRFQQTIAKSSHNQGKAERRLADDLDMLLPTLEQQHQAIVQRRIGSGIDAGRNLRRSAIRSLQKPMDALKKDVKQLRLLANLTRLENVLANIERSLR